MSRRIIALLAGLAATAAMAIVLPIQAASAADCASAWSSGAVYVGGNQASYNSHNWQAKWWTQGETPGSADVWADQGSCGGGGGTPTPGTCDYPNWAQGHNYITGDIVRYTNGNLYIAEHDNPGYDPTISTWYWDPYTCTGGGTTTPPPSGDFVVTEAQFNQMFPNRNSFYSYSGLTTAMGSFTAFAKTGSDTIRKQEAAAFLANVNHETGGLYYIVEQNTANYPHYCDTSQSYGCPAGQSAYYGRGPIQLSWNFNYKAAGDALGIDLLNDPYKVERDAAISWKTALWYWMTQNGPGTMTPHNAMVNSRGFGETIRSINGSIECNGGNPAQVQSRVDAYKKFTGILGVDPGGNLSC
ncbi:chitinase [Longispora fulva]|uniref:Chitinase n=1 Tax=Longispora fulva TaxID=619741 RepID=A0A8J7GEN5_9ACTN|nr:glycoside hydrolase family 19 protein [Longispora fulva]MBG6134393.1 chitinase [Longispora fulva]GIG62690.1 chitinase [Longispora fulva]